MNAIVPLELRVIALVTLTALLIWVVTLIRRQKLSVQDSLAWLVTTLAAVVVAAFPELLVALARLVGVQVPSNALFAAGLVYLAVNLLSVTIAASENSARTRRLAQECALLRAELDRLSAAVAAGPSDAPGPSGRPLDDPARGATDPGGAGPVTA